MFNKKYVYLQRKKKFTPNILKPIIIDFKTLCDTSIDLSKEIEMSYGLNGNGIMFINNIPNYAKYKNNLLPLAKKIHDFPPNIKRKYERPEINYLLGILTYEKYHFKGTKDTTTSWYSCLRDNIDDPIKKLKDGKEIVEILPEIFWPTEELPDFEP